MVKSRYYVLYDDVLCSSTSFEVRDVDISHQISTHHALLSSRVIIIFIIVKTSSAAAEAGGSF